VINAFPARLVSVVVLVLSVVTCSPREKAQAPDPVELLQSVPQPDSRKYESIVDMRNWRNPYLVIRTDGVALLDPVNSVEVLLKPDEVLGALARLPRSAWPYGRIVAVSENGLRASPQDDIAIRRNRGIVGGTLEGAHIAVNWVPSA
jgi:hypothetical protein